MQWVVTVEAEKRGGQVTLEADSEEEALQKGQEWLEQNMNLKPGASFTAKVAKQLPPGAIDVTAGTPPPITAAGSEEAQG